MDGEALIYDVFKAAEGVIKGAETAAAESSQTIVELLFDIEMLKLAGDAVAKAWPEQAAHVSDEMKRMLSVGVVLPSAEA